MISAAIDIPTRGGLLDTREIDFISRTRDLILNNAADILTVPSPPLPPSLLCPLEVILN